MNARRGRLVLAFVGLLAATVGTKASGLETAVSDYQLKGAYLFNFIRLIEWPTVASARGAMLPVCVLGDSPIAGVLEAMAKTPVKNRKLVVVPVRGAADTRPCEVLFVSQGTAADIEGIVRAIPPGVLTVTEIETDLRVSSVINFVTDNRRIVFDVNAEAASRAQLSISARLLNVARAVDGRKRRRD
jgi:YfiR/HmsC-like